MKKEYDFSLSVPAGKTRVTIRLDTDILEWFRANADAAGGGNYQTMINQALREFIGRAREPLETTLRRDPGRATPDRMSIEVPAGLI